MQNKGDQMQCVTLDWILDLRRAFLPQMVEYLRKTVSLRYQYYVHRGFLVLVSVWWLQNTHGSIEGYRNTWSLKCSERIITICDPGCKVHVWFFVLFSNFSVSLKLFQNKKLNTLKGKKEVIKNSLAVNWLVLQAFTTSAWDLSLVSRQGVPASCASQPPKKKSDLNN